MYCLFTTVIGFHLVTKGRGLLGDQSSVGSYRLHTDRVGASTFLWVSLTQECETLFKELESERKKQEWSCTKTRGELVLLKNWFPSRKRNTGCSSSIFPLRSTWFTWEVKPRAKITPTHSPLLIKAYCISAPLISGLFGLFPGCSMLAAPCH